MFRIFFNICFLLPFCIFGQTKQTIVDQLNTKAKEYIHIDLDSAFYFTDNAVKKAKKHHYLEGEMEAEFQLGRIYYDQARRTLAMESGLRSLDIAEKLDNYTGKKNALNLIGKIQNHANQLEDGIKTVRRNYNLAKIEGDSIEMALMNHFLGIFKNKMGEQDSAFYFTMQSMNINKKLKTQKALAYNYNSLGIHHYGKRNLDTALFYFRNALKIRTELKLPNQTIEAYNNLGYVFLMEKIADSAIIYFQKCIDVCLEYGKKSNLGIAYKNIAEAYEIAENHEAALAALKKAIPINDSLAGIKQKEQIISAQKAKNEELSILNDLAKKGEQKQLLLIIALLIILVITIIIFQKSKRKSIENIVQIQKTKAAKTLIDEQEKVSDDIAQDLHDGVGGSLACLKLNLSILQDENNCPKLADEINNVDKIYQEIRNISHNLTAVSFKKNSLETTLEQYLDRTFPDLAIGMCFQCYPKQEITSLYYDQKICVYRIIQELASNIQKHAKASNVNVMLTGHGNHLTIIAEDNGIGFDPTMNNKGIGLNNIRKRIALYDGEMQIDSHKGKGTTIIIDIPYKRPKT